MSEEVYRRGPFWVEEDHGWFDVMVELPSDESSIMLSQEFEDNAIALVDHLVSRVLRECSESEEGA